jgi:hypothetical protein
MNLSLDEALEEATFQLFSIEVVRVKVANSSVDDFTAVSADFGGSPRCLLKQFSVVCPRRWQ